MYAYLKKKLMCLTVAKKAFLNLNLSPYIVTVDKPYCLRVAPRKSMRLSPPIGQHCLKTKELGTLVLWRPHWNPRSFTLHLTLLHGDLRQGLGQSGRHSSIQVNNTPKLLYHQTPFHLLCNSTLLEKWVHIRAFVYLIWHLAGSYCDA